MKLLKLLFVVLSFSALQIRAQIVHHELWSRIYLNHELPKGFKIESEYQFRVQNKPYENIIPTTHLAHAARVWIYKKAGKTWRIGLSPFAIFRNYPSITTEDDLVKSNNWEIRFAANAECTYKIGSFGLRYRPGFEERLTKPDNKEEWTSSPRMRNRLQIDYNFAKVDSSLAPLTVSVGDEHFFRIEELMHEEPCFDQNRVFAGVAWKFNKMVSLSANAFLIHRPGSSGYNQHRMLWINLIIEI